MYKMILNYKKETIKREKKEVVGDQERNNIK